MRGRRLLFVAMLLAVSGCSDGSSEDSGGSDPTPAASAPDSGATTADTISTSDAPAVSEPSSSSEPDTTDGTTTTRVPTSEAPTTDVSTTGGPATDSDVEPDDLVAALEELEEAVESGDTETARRFGGEAAEARAWVRKVDVVVSGRRVDSIAVSGDLTVVSDDGTELVTEGEYSVRRGASENAIVASDPVFRRADGELELVRATPAPADDSDKASFVMQALAGEPAESDGTSIVVRTVRFEQSSSPTNNSAQFILSFEGTDVRTPISAVWTDATGVEHVAAPVRVAADEESGTTVGGVTFSESLNASILDALGTFTLAYADGTLVEIPLPDVPELDDAERSLATQLLPGAPTADPDLDVTAATAAIRDVVTTFADATVRCTAHPGVCAADAPSFGREVRSRLLGAAEDLEAENQRMLYFPGAVTARLDDVRIHESGRFAAVDVCIRDGSVLVDNGSDRVAPEDDQVVDDEIESFRELYTFDATESGWRITNSVRMEEYESGDECLTTAFDDSVTFLDDFVATGGPGLDAIGEVESAEDLADFFEQTVAAANAGGLRAKEIAKVLTDTYPSLLVKMQAVKSSPSILSILVSPLDKGADASATNPVVAVGAFLDTSGRCLGRVVYGFPEPATVISVDPPADDCSAAAAFELAATTIAASG